MIELVKIILLGLLEGITEYLPVSSTGHLIVAVALLQPALSAGSRETFEIFIQLGAVLAVILYYAGELLGQARVVRQDTGVQRLWLGIVIAFIPAAVIGLLFRSFIKDVLFNPVTVAVSLIVGGIILIVVERLPALRARAAGNASSLIAITPAQALVIGLAQTVSLVPGVSRSAASIVGGMLAGLDRATATKFSFYLAIPTLGLATIAELVLSLDEVQASDLPYFIIGTLVAAVVAWLSIRWLLRYVASHTFVPFGIYRIIAGVVILLLIAAAVIPV